MANMLLVRILVFVLACTHVVFYSIWQSELFVQREKFVLFRTKADLQTVKYIEPKILVSKAHFQTMTTLPPYIINIKGKHTQIPTLARNSEQIPVRGSERVTLQEIDGYLKQKAINNDVMITVCDSGYLDIYRLFYRLNKMWQYPNFVTFVLDKKGYDVCILFVLL